MTSGPDRPRRRARSRERDIAQGPDDPAVPDGAFDAFNLRGRVAAITGAARGFGRAYAELLAMSGAHVVCAEVKPSDRTVDIITQRCEISYTEILDVTDRKGVVGLADEIVSRHGGLDIMVNDAGINIRVSATDTTEGAIDRAI